MWPLPNNKKITSHFGKRKSPTKGSSSNHSGIDIAAPEGTPFISAITGTITFTGFKGAGGYTITIQNSNYEISYCHTSANYLYKTGDIVLKGDILGHVGPKYITPISNNKYTDSSGRQTNGATTGCHLHFSIKKDGTFVNPLDYIDLQK